ncbi:hypothetical protein ABZ896_32810 [Streptomyces sp. NPDC047072]|uniref:hypothetical protein n=1 Tax=Streptomyces sp. NPDC047072 TaxID=3154809 RepID=UPI0033F658BD
MGRHAPRRAGRATLVSALAVALAAGFLTLFSGNGNSGAQAATTTAATTEILLDDPNTETRRTDQLLAAGGTGFLHRQGRVAGLLWTDYDDGTTVTVEGPTGVYTPTTTSCYDIAARCASGVFGQAPTRSRCPTAPTATRSRSGAPAAAPCARST